MTILGIIFKSGERKETPVIYDGKSEHDALVLALSRLDAVHEEEPERLPDYGFCGLDCEGTRGDCCKIRPRPFKNDMPCKNENSNICVAEGCFAASCLKVKKEKQA